MINPYIIGGVAFGFMALAGVAGWYGWDAAVARAEAAQARADLETALVSNRALEATVGRLRASAEANDRLLAEMQDTLDAINESVTSIDDGIDDLKDSDETVRDYLSGIVPDALRLQLDR